MADEAADLSRRIDDLLSGAIDEQVREQRALADLMLGVKDGITRLVDQVASLGDQVEAARDASERVALAPAASGPVGGEIERFESIETAIGELSATIAALADRPDPVSLDPEEARALFGTIAEAAAGAASEEGAAIRELFQAQLGGVRDTLVSQSTAARESLLAEALASREAVLAETAALKEANEQQYANLARRLSEAKATADSLEQRLAEVEASMKPVAEAPAQVRSAVAELTIATTEQTDAVLDQVQASSDAAAARLTETAQRLSDDASRIVSATDGLLGKFDGLREELLAYLQVRDVALEEERDRVITELIEEFAGHLEGKQRKLFARGMRAAWASRSDKRAARLFRLNEGQVLPRMPQVPADALRDASEGLAKSADVARQAAAKQAPARPAVPVSRAEVPIRPRPAEPKIVTPRPAIVTPRPARVQPTASPAPVVAMPRPTVAVPVEPVSVPEQPKTAPKKRAVAKKSLAKKTAPKKASPRKTKGDETEGEAPVRVAPEPETIAASTPIVEESPAPLIVAEPGSEPIADPQPEALSELTALAEEGRRPLDLDLPEPEPTPEPEPDSEPVPSASTSEAAQAPEPEKIAENLPAKAAKPSKKAEKAQVPEDRRAMRLQRAARRRAQAGGVRPTPSEDPSGELAGSEEPPPVD